MLSVSVHEKGIEGKEKMTDGERDAGGDIFPARSVDWSWKEVWLNLGT